MPEYTKDNIQVLSDLDHIRSRSGMYIGDAIDPRHLFSEALDNALDEIQNGYGDSVIVSINTKENKYTISDDGRGIPHGEKVLEDGSKVETVKLVCTKSFAGGKFNNDGYALRSGLHGLGLTIINALSETLKISSFRNGAEISYETSNDIIENKKAPKNCHGTIITFIPDSMYFQNSVIPKEYIIERCKIANAFGMKTRLIIDDSEMDVSAEIDNLLPGDTEDVKIYQDLPMISSSENRHSEHLEILIRYTSDTSDRYRGYTNLLYNSLGGTHVNLVSTRIIINAWEEVIRKLRIRTEVPLRKSDYLVGLRCLVAAFISDPEFSSQTKEKLTTPKKSLENFAEICQKKLVKALCNSPEISKGLIKRFEEYRLSQNRLLARKEISSLIKVSDDNPNNIRRRSVVSKLVECTSRKRDNTELFLVEGDSAMGPYLSTRNRELQAVLPLRGKILNVTYKDVKDAIKNKEICDIANSIGCGIGASCDASKSRYERVIISADADPDGLQINCLVLSVFINMFPDMVKQGRVFLTTPPLYCWGNNSKNYGWCNDVNEIPKAVKEVHRFKGLGEMNSDQLEFFLVNPTTRNLIQVEYPDDVDKFNKILGTSVGKHELMIELGIIQN